MSVIGSGSAPQGRLHTVSVVDALEEQLREEIFAGEISPGERIKEAPLAKTLGVSRHTLRSALSRLENVGLLFYRENHGWSVPIFGREEYEDILLLRESLETSAYQVILRTGKKPNQAVDQALQQILSMSEEDSWADKIEADCRLHQALVDLAGSPRLSSTFADMMDEFRLCRLQSVEWLDQLPLEEWKQIHVSLVESLQLGGMDLLREVSYHFTSDPWRAPRTKREQL